MLEIAPNFLNLITYLIFLTPVSQSHCLCPVFGTGRSEMSATSQEKLLITIIFITDII